jgi:hypothetical protein
MKHDRVRGGKTKESIILTVLLNVVDDRSRDQILHAHLPS